MSDNIRVTQLLCKQVLRLFYSPARRLHPDAKYRFVEPDLAPLPTIVTGEADVVRSRTVE